MKLLFDENSSFRLCRYLVDLFPSSTQVRAIGLEREADRAIWEYAKANEFAIVTLDGDFMDLAALLGPPPKVIWLRCGNRPTAAVEALLRNHADLIADFGRDASSCLEIY